MHIVRSHHFTGWSFLAPLGMTAALWAHVVSAQSPDASEQLGGAFARLESAQAYASGVVVNAQNASHFKSLIAPELYPLVRNGSFEMNAYRKLNYDWRYDAEWVRNSLRFEQETLTSEETPAFSIATARGFVFGLSSGIAKESDSRKQALKVLWNTQSLLWAQKIINVDFELGWFKDSSLAGRVSGNVIRIYPRWLEGEHSAQLFRERIVFTTPAVIRPLAYLTFRFFGSEEDILWFFSPAIHKVRQLTGSNRSDPVMRSGISLDDFSVWLGKPELLEAVLTKATQVLIPFHTLDMADLVTQADCVSPSGDPQPEGAVGNFLDELSSRKLLPESIPIPGSVVFVPREVYRLELLPKDPFSAYGRQILYVDTLSMLPIYKIVFDRAGQLSKIVWGVFGLAASRSAITTEETRRVPYPFAELMWDATKDQPAVLLFSYVEYCDASREGLQLTELDPTRLTQLGQEEIKEHSNVPGT